MIELTISENRTKICQVRMFLLQVISDSHMVYNQSNMQTDQLEQNLFRACALTQSSKTQSTYLILGLGLNIGTPPYNKQLNKPSTSLTAITDSPINTQALTASILAAWQDCQQVFNTDGLHTFLSRWKNRDKLYNQLIRYRMNGSQLEGHAHGVNEQGLLLITHNNQQQACSPSELSLIRPVD